MYKSFFCLIIVSLSLHTFSIIPASSKVASSHVYQVHPGLPRQHIDIKFIHMYKGQYQYCTNTLPQTVSSWLVAASVGKATDLVILLLRNSWQPEKDVLFNLVRAVDEPLTTGRPGLVGFAKHSLFPSSSQRLGHFPSSSSTMWLKPESATWDLRRGAIRRPGL